MKPSINAELIRSLRSFFPGLPTEGNGVLSLWRGYPTGTYTGGLAALMVVGAGTIGALIILKQLSGFLPTPAMPARSQNRRSSVSTLERLTVPGLQNMGNNCFLNVILQALASSKTLLSFVASHSQRSMVVFQSSPLPVPLAKAVLTLLEELSVLDVKPRIASPRRVMLALELYARNFDFAAQQDAAEALAHLASAFREERLECFENCRAYAQSLVDAASFIAHGSCALNGMAKQEKSEIQSLHIWRRHARWPMEGTMGSLLTCQNCGFQFSTQFDFFHEVPLSPPRKADGTIIEGCTIEDCLEHFTAPEWVSDFKCSYCSHSSAVYTLLLRTGASRATIQKIKDCSCDDDCSCETLISQQGALWRDVYTNAFKQLRFGCCPEVLCFNIQRAVISEAGDLVKLMEHVSFPNVLNLFPFTISAKAHSKLESDSKSEINLKHDIERVGHPHYRALWQKGALRIFGKEDKVLGIKSSNASFSADESSSVSTSLNDLCEIDNVTHSCDHVSKRSTYKKLHPPQHGDCEDCKLNPEHDLNFEEVSSAERKFSLQSGQNPYFSGNLDLATSILSGRQMLPSATRLAYSDNKVCDVAGDTLHPLPGIYSVLQSHMSNQVHTLSSLPTSVDVNGCASSTTLEGPENISKASRLSARCLYELISVVVHHGGPRSGHYTVYRKVKVATKVSQKSQDRVGLQKSKHTRIYGVEPSMVNNDSEQIVDLNVEGHQACRRLCKTGGSDAFDVHDAVSFSVRGGFELTELRENTLTSKSSPVEDSIGCLGVSSSVEEEINNLLCTSSEQANIVLWFRVSDSIVEKVTEKEVLMSQATLLFYERCDDTEESRE